MRTEVTKVHNLSNNTYQVYTCPPREAVVCAYEQSRKNWNTWQYDYSKAVVSKSGRTISCGDFVAQLR